MKQLSPLTYEQLSSLKPGDPIICIKPNSKIDKGKTYYFDYIKEDGDLRNFITCLIKIQGNRAGFYASRFAKRKKLRLG